MEIIAVFNPKRLDPRKLPPDVKDIVLEVVYNARYIVDQLTSVPAEDEL